MPAATTTCRFKFETFNAEFDTGPARTATGCCNLHLPGDTAQAAVFILLIVLSVTRKNSGGGRDCDNTTETWGLHYDAIVTGRIFGLAAQVRDCLLRNV